MSHPSFACRSCRHPGVEPVLCLGATPLANALLTAEQLQTPEPVYPLDLVFCPACSLLQITETVPPEQLFGEYLYFSSFSDTLVRRAADLVAETIAARKLDSDSLVIEVASNDGYLLQHYAGAGIPVLGIEPARNIAAVAQERGVRTLCAFFGEDLARALADWNERADVLHANNVLAHVADLNGFVRGIGLALKDDGIAIIEVPYVKDLVDHCEFDTIYHEHLCYFSATALDALFSRHGLILADAERVPIHGGSLRLFVQKPMGRVESRESERRAPAGANRRRVDSNGESLTQHSALSTQHFTVRRSDRICRLLADEEAQGIAQPDYYRDFAARVETLKHRLNDLLRDLRQQGKRIAAYGAAAKGATLLNYFGIGCETLEFVVDRNTHKQGRYMPGAHIPIRPPEALLESRPDFVLLLSWNFADEILAQQAVYRAQGGRFIVPVPEVRIV